MFHQSGAAFDPIPVIAICYSIDFAQFGGMDVTADYAIHITATGVSNNRILVA